MAPHPLRVVTNQASIIEDLKKLHQGLEFSWVAPEALRDQIGKADIFLLDDETAIRFLGPLAEENWPSVVVFAKDGESVPASYQQGLVDDILVLPARNLDLERILRNHAQIQSLRQLEASSKGVADLVKHVHHDLQLAQKVQRRLIREKFPALGALSVKTKYWCGLKSGGDYFDVIDFPGGTHAGILLADCSSYALSTNLIGTLLHVSQASAGDPREIVQSLFGKLRESWRENDRLSLFYGVLDRKTYALRYVNCGGVFLAKRNKEGKIQWGAKGETLPLTLQTPEVGESKEVVLEPGDRMILCSDGWGEALDKKPADWLETVLGFEHDSQDLMNEMGFRLRKELERKAGEDEAEDDFPMPPQDCSVLLFELAQKALRLAK